MDPHNTKVFISYSVQEDPKFISKLHSDLSKKGFDVWLDKHDMRSRGRTFLQEIRDAIAAVDRLILVIGPLSVKSDYVNIEWKFADERCVVINPILRKGDTSLLPKKLSKLHTFDFRNDNKYEKQLEALTSELMNEVEPLGKLNGFSPLPLHYINRPDSIQRVRDIVCDDLISEEYIKSNEMVSAIHGMGGIGKSVLANAFGRDCFTRRAFSGGIIWLLSGENPDNRGHLIKILSIFSATPAGPESINELLYRTLNILKEEKVLVIMDDVRDIKDVRPILGIFEGASRLLLTTREADVARSIAGKKVYLLKMLSINDAKDLLAQTSQNPLEDPSSEIDELIRLCGNLPLALALCGAMSRDGIAWSDMIQSIKDADLKFVESNLHGYDYSTIFAALKVSVDSLARDRPDIANLYQKLAVFSPGASIPEKAIFNLWNENDQLKLRYVRKFLSILQNKALLNINANGHTWCVELHDLLHTYISALCKDSVNLHNTLLTAYRKNCSGAWEELNDDGYILDNLFDHFIKGQQLNEMIQLLNKENLKGRNVWWDVKTANDPSSIIYSKDVLLAREEFIKKNLQSIDLNTPHLPMLGLEMLTYLFQVSLSSLFSEITGDMLVNLVDAGHLKIEHAVSIVKQIPEGYYRTEAYKLLAPRLNLFQLHQAIRDTESIKEAESRDEAL